MLVQLDQKIEKMKEELVAWRRFFHRNPELSFQEEHTSQFVYEALQSFGSLEVTRPTRTSVVARLKGKRPGTVLAIRADMDALPITEENKFEYSSVNTGVMHACGHDGHTAVLLGTAKLLASMQDELCGEIRFIFQHGEELPPGGAKELVQAGVLDGVDQIIGAHLWSPLETGKISVLSGPTMAGGDIFNIVVKGVGGHAGMPHQTVDPIPVAAQIITNLQQIVSRQIDPLDHLVLSITKMNAGMTHNAIPETAEINGTVRYFNPSYRQIAPEMMEKIIKGITQAHGAEYTFEYLNGYLPVVNDPTIAEAVEKSVREHQGNESIEVLRPPMVGEDFSSYLEKTPGCFILVGAGNQEKGIIYPHHHPRFTIDEEALSIAMKLFVHFAWDLLHIDVQKIA